MASDIDARLASLALPVITKGLHVGSFPWGLGRCVPLWPRQWLIALYLSCGGVRRRALRLDIQESSAAAGQLRQPKTVGVAGCTLSHGSRSAAGTGLPEHDGSEYLGLESV